MAWLLTGEGEMMSNEEGIYENVPASEKSYEIPLLDLDASAGFSSVDALGDNSRRTLTLPKCDGAITIVGKSMDPTIHDGDIAVFDMVNSPSSIRPDGIYIVQYTDEDNDVHLTVKRVKRSPEGSTYIRLSADNPEYGYEDVPLKSISRVAKVLYTITKLSY
ncbi:MAG: S24 family peptidase [Muribaculaceae bacterium]|nr:S24 family peptidase [Muribaculaceae bacterium]